MRCPERDRSSAVEEPAAQMVSYESHAIAEHDLEADGDSRPFAVAHFSGDGRDRNDAWRVKEVQDHVGEGSDRSEHIRNAGHDLFVFGFCCDAIQDSQVLIAFSFAISAEMTATAPFQSPRPSGAKIQEIA